MYLAIGIITLFLTGFMLIYYAYLFRNTDHDVSFFISVGVIFMVMNLFTNMGTGSRVLSFLYLVVSIAFLALGWAVDVEGSKAFYTSIGPFFKGEFTHPEILWKALSFVLPPVGIVMYFASYKSNNERALVSGKCGLWGLLIWCILIWAIVGIL